MAYMPEESYDRVPAYYVYTVVFYLDRCLLGQIDYYNSSLTLFNMLLFCESQSRETDGAKKAKRCKCRQCIMWSYGPKEPVTPLPT
jgi:hypothetical protein